MMEKKQRIAVVGAGISGLASAYFLSRKHDVVLYEAESRLGGHANTVEVTSDGMRFPVDTGFLVFNDVTYPNLIALFDELGVASHATSMTFGVSAGGGALEWAGTSADTVFAQRGRLLSPAFWGMLRDILRFNAAAPGALAEAQARHLTLGQVLEAGRYGQCFRDAYLLPMAAAIWSSAPRDILSFPAATFLRFCLNHGLLQINGRPQWRSVAGGSREYVQRIAAALPDVRLACPVQRIERRPGYVMVASAGGADAYDAVVLATHAPQALRLLADATPAERAVLSPLRTQPNQAYLHRDPALMPHRRKVWSAWNYLEGEQADGARPVCVSYWLNALQQLPCQSDWFVTLNPATPPAPDLTAAQFDYAHPLFDQAAIDAQRGLDTIQGADRAWFAGAWSGYGFHEDGLKSALRVAERFGVAPAWAKVGP